MNAIVIICVLCLFLCQFNAENITDYYKKRANWIAKESQQALGSKLVLTEKETLTNDLLMKWKKMETDGDNPHYLNFSGSYFSYRDGMRRSKVYTMIRRMPKGAALHDHATLMLDPDDLVKFTYEDHLYACLTDTDLNFHFAYNTPTQNCSVQWSLVKDLRNKYKNITQFDAKLKEHLTLGPNDRVGPKADTYEAWKEFEHKISVIFSLIEYRPVREKMIYQTFQNLYDDNVMYVELRMGLCGLYELNGTVHDKMYLALLYNQVAKNFIKNNPDFAGMKIILTRSRNLNVDILREDLNLARKVKQSLPEVFAGYDLVGHEDLGKPLTEFVPILLPHKGELNYYFHAGETDWNGASVDENLFDAILLGTKRIGHGYALIKHPFLMEVVNQNGIALEVNVISNSILSLVQDLRTHPLATYLAQGLPVVLSSDDPGVWGAKPLSDDFYVAFVAIASKHADLRMLKQLAINSIRYSALDDEEKNKLMKTFDKQWLEFIKNTLDDKTYVDIV